MADIQSVDEAYEQLAEAMNYLRSELEGIWPEDGMIQGLTGVVVYSNPRGEFLVRRTHRHSKGK